MNKKQNVLINIIAILVAALSYLAIKMRKNGVDIQTFQIFLLSLILLSGATLISNNIYYLKYSQNKILSSLSILLGIALVIIAGIVLFTVLSFKNAQLG
jgi:CDP-diglyceride synthetase